MATFTTNYNLRKPATSDFVTVTTDINANMDTIDTELKDHEDRLAHLDPGVGTWTDITGDLTAETGWTVNEMYTYRVGPIVFVVGSVRRTGGDLTFGSSGNLGDTSMLTGWPVALRPNTSNNFLYGARGSLHFVNFRVTTAGELQVTHGSPNGTLLDEENVQINGFYTIDSVA